VGQENHVGRYFFRLGLRVDNQFPWIGPEGKPDLRYMTDTLVTQVSLYHEGLKLLLSCRDTVDFHENIYLREIIVENLVPRPREIRLFFSQDFNILEKLLAEYPTSDSAAEAIYLQGVSRYKKTHEAKPLKEAYERLLKDYPSSEWTKRASPYRLL
jgi:hypothetical protein